MKEYERETIKRARQTNLAEYLLFHGEPLIRTGNRYRHKEHESLVFTENAYYWNARGESGNAIDFLVRHRGMDFKTALYELTGLTSDTTPTVEHEPTAQKKPAPFTLAAYDIELNMSRAIAYLNKSRGIDYKIIQWLIKNKLLFQEGITNNILFPMYNELGAVVGAEVQGTLTNPGKRFKGIKTGSKYGYGYNINPNQSNAIKYVLYFESAVDLLSFWDIKKTESKSLSDCLLVSMAGVKENVFRQMLVTVKQAVEPVLCVDNDEAGQSFIRIITANHSGNLRTLQPPPQFKDWNEQLQTMRTSQ